MKIAFVGSRGIPANYGGFETFVEKLSVGLANDYNYEVYVVSDKKQKEDFKGVSEYKGVKILYSKFDKGNHPNLFYLHSFLLVLFKVKIIYSCGVAGAFSSPIPILFGKKLMVNPDGIGWRRQKWSKWKKVALYSMFWFTAKFTPHLVNDSLGIKKTMRKEFNRKRNSHVIEYGAELNQLFDDKSDVLADLLSKYEIEAMKYHLVVARLEPENNVKMIMEGYIKSDQKYPLVIIGNLMDTTHVHELKQISKGSTKIKMIGGVYGDNKLDLLRANALSYFHGHSVGGTNPSLLEAMGSKNLTFAHDNIFNRETLLENAYFFSNPEQLAKQIDSFESAPFSDKHNDFRQGVYNRVESYYNWKSIIKRYSELFKSV